jgi:tetraacyldisaccharide 4'-kinase
LVGRDRNVVGQHAVSRFGAEILVLDDGFQHHRLRRDLDVVMLDAGIGLGNGWVLPRGPLREPVDAMRYAHAIGSVDGALPAEAEAIVSRFCPGALRFDARRRPVALRPLAGGAATSPRALRGAAVGILAGIGQPASLRRTLERLGARVVAERCFGDHHRYRRRDVAGLSRAAGLWITTEKDAPKIHPAWTAGVDVRVLAIELEVDDEHALLDWIEMRLRQGAG